MHDFGKFCYLDVQKTGSSFIAKFLRKHSTLEETEMKAHGRITSQAQLADGKLFFISVREPVDQYKSLYFFGASQKGGALRSILTRRNKGFEEFYDGSPEGFSAWLDFVLDPANHAHLGQGYTAGEAALYGMMTYRFLALSFFRPKDVLPTLKDRDSLVDFYARNKLHMAVLKNESLNEDLARLVEGPLRPYMLDADEAAGELRSTARKVNESPREKEKGFVIGDEVIARIRAREWFMHDVLGYA